MVEKILAKLKTNLSAKRLAHCLGVSESAVQLAALYGADSYKARLAGLLHDCAREMSNNILLQTAEAFGMLVNDVEQREPKLLHASVGAFIARRDYGVDDPEILKAITLHTTGGAGMSVLDNIIFLADCVEPGRSFPGVDKLRMLAKNDLGAALLAAYDQTLEYLISKQGLVHPATLEGRNALLLKTRK